jgi:hypothetical protein
MQLSPSCFCIACPDWLADKKINLLMQIGSKRDADFKDLPLMTDLAANTEDRRILSIYSGDVALGRSFITTEGVPLTGWRRSAKPSMRL